MLGPSPYTLATPAFTLRALAVAAGRSPLGGARESLLALLIGARLAAAAVAGSALTPPQRRLRAEHARNWLGTVALPPVPKVAAARLIDATAGEDKRAILAALAKVTEVTAQYLDRPARLDLDSLAARLAE